MKHFGLVTSNTAFIPPLSCRPGDMWHCISLIWRVHPRGEGPSANPSLIFPLFCCRPQCHTAPAHPSHHRHWVKGCLGPRRANSALTSTALTARRVAQAHLEARARQVTIPAMAITAAWVFIGGYTPSATATEQIREMRTENTAFPNSLLLKLAKSCLGWERFLCQRSPDWQNCVFL